MTSLEADWVMKVAIAATLSDENIDPEESVRLRMLAYLNPMYREVESVDDYILDCVRRVRSAGPWTIGAKAAKKLDMPLRELAFSWAAEMIYAADDIHPEEHEFLSHLAGDLEIPGELAGKIMAVSGIRNRTQEKSGAKGTC